VDTYRCAHNGQHPYLLSIRPDGHEMTLTKLEPKAREKFRKRMPFVDAYLPTLSECKAVIALRLSSLGQSTAP